MSQLKLAENESRTNGIAHFDGNAKSGFIPSGWHRCGFTSYEGYHRGHDCMPGGNNAASDDPLTASVLTRSDLVTGSWTTNAPMGITLNDGGLGSYTNNIGTAEDQQFFKLLVE